MAKPIIYKYFRVNSFLYDTLISNQIYFSSIKQFNDPYDCHMAVLNDISEEDLLGYLKNNNLPEHAYEMYLSSFRKKPKEFIKPFLDVYRDLLNYYGICCFTKSKENILLWSHYSDSHKGVCLGFDYKIMADQFKLHDNVDYNDDPFYFDIKNSMDSVAKTILRKSTNWKYEEEIRFLMERSKNVGFKREALLEINFGSKCSNRDRMNIQYLTSKLDYSNCKFYQGIIDEKFYKVNFEISNMETLRKEVLKDSEDKRFSKEVNLEHLLK